MTKKAEAWHCVPCTGEAHSNPYIDNCWTCAPLWGEVLVPVSCPDLESWYARLREAGKIGAGWTQAAPAYRSLRRRQKIAMGKLQRAEREAERTKLAERVSR